MSGVLPESLVGLLIKRKRCNCFICEVKAIVLVLSVFGWSGAHRSGFLLS